MNRLPLFPLHTVLFPGAALPLQIFEARYVDLVSACLRDGSGFGVAPILRGREVGAPAETYPVGTLAHITDWDQGANGLLRIMTAGAARFRILDVSNRANGLVDGEIAWFDDADDPPPVEHAHLAELLEALCQRISPERPIPGPLSSRNLAYRLAELLPFDIDKRVALLSEPAANAQLRLVEREIHAIFR